ncbi:MAG: NAD(P)/FAD-dependent oxidoreductase [Phycisphaerales bacterium]
MQRPTPPNIPTADAAIIGAGAAGLFAAIFAARTHRALKPHAPPPTIIALDGAKKLGAKILVAGGGRCNVTHHRVDEKQYAGSDPASIKKVLRRFTVADTRRFFAEHNIELKQEDTGKLFPTTDDAHTILDALLHAARTAPAHLIHPWRTAAIDHDPPAHPTHPTHPFLIHRDPDWRAHPPDQHPTAPQFARATAIRARRIVLATGGKALPKTGSDGLGHHIARSLNHSITHRVFPALVPLILDPSLTFAHTLSGIATPATLEVRAHSGKLIKRFTNSLLCTHFGISGPAALDISRHYLDAAHHDPGATLIINWLPEHTRDAIDKALLALGHTTINRFLRDTHNLPERLARALADHAGIDPATPAHALTREQRKRLAATLTEMPLPVTGDRGYTHAEVTAGGVPLDELDLATMESRRTPALHIVGELCDVDGRIGGFNFQWAWASGFIAGTAIAHALASAPDEAPAKTDAPTQSPTPSTR